MFSPLVVVTLKYGKGFKLNFLSKFLSKREKFIKKVNKVKIWIKKTKNYSTSCIGTLGNHTLR